MLSASRVPLATCSNVNVNPLLSKVSTPTTTKSSGNILGLEPFWARSSSVISPPECELETGRVLEPSTSVSNDENLQGDRTVAEQRNHSSAQCSFQEIQKPKTKTSRVRTRVSVVVRVRPLIVSTCFAESFLRWCYTDDKSQEEDKYHEDGLVETSNFSSAVDVHSDTSLKLCRQFHDSRKYVFDNVIGPSLAQEKMYEVVAMDVVEDVCSGFNGSILCYGQTGSGKT